jgi:murein DD-endopeptidase MepM/ murein hydrolase activator NlpD
MSGSTYLWILGGLATAAVAGAWAGGDARKAAPVAAKKKASSSSVTPRPKPGTQGSYAWPLPADQVRDVPVVGGPQAGRAFGVSRPYSDAYRCNRRHVGVDLKAREGDVVVATEPGVIVATQGWDGPAAKALLLQTDRGPVVLYGAVAPGSWSEFGVGPGIRVQTGQPLGRIGRYPKGSSMLHFELYEQGTMRNRVWCAGRPLPQGALDPTSYLLMLQETSSRIA